MLECVNDEAKINQAKDEDRGDDDPRDEFNSRGRCLWVVTVTSRRPDKGHDGNEKRYHRPRHPDRWQRK